MDKALGYIECEILCFEDDQAVHFEEMGIKSPTEYRWGIIMVDKVETIVPRDDGNATVSLISGDSLEVNEPYSDFLKRFKKVLDAL
jgi:hypothetical protein